MAAGLRADASVRALKPKKKTKGAILFNPESRNAYISGFKKRKEERRAKAKKEKLALEKEARKIAKAKEIAEAKKRVQETTESRDKALAILERRLAEKQKKRVGV